LIKTQEEILRELEDARSQAERVEVPFRYPIAKILDYDGVIVVLLEIPTGAKFNENVYGIDLTGNVLWRVPEKRYVYEDSPYTDIVRDGDDVVLFNWDGLQLTVEPKTGSVLSEDCER
jgi:hypothetical protein